MTKIATSTTQAAKQISEEMEVPLDIIKNILSSFTHKMLICLEHEEPFRVNGFGKFFFKYHAKVLRKDEKSPHIVSTFYEDKVKRVLQFKPISSVMTTLEQWVHDLGLKNNLSSASFSSVKFEPKEISKVRKNRILLEQASLGFNEAVFDDAQTDHVTKKIMQAEQQTPTVQEILEQMIKNVTK